MGWALFSIFAALLAPMVVVTLLLYPACLLSRDTRRRPLQFVAWSALASFVWGFAFLLGAMPITSLASRPGGTPPIIVSVLAAGVAVPFMTGGAALLGVIFAQMTTLPGVLMRLTIAGAALSVGGVILCSTPYELLTRIAAALVPLGWIVIPPAVFYWCALTRRRTLGRYERAACVYCGCEGGGRTRACPECTRTTPCLCHRCRRFSSRPPGAPCPRCRARLGTACWKCGYDLRGVESNRCPECGVWRAANAGANPL